MCEIDSQKINLGNSQVFCFFVHAIYMKKEKKDDFDKKDPLSLFVPKKK